jgi:hypothetical protein
VEVSDGVPASGVLVVQGSVLGGWSFHLSEGGTLSYVHNLSGLSLERVDADVRLDPGLHDLAFRYTPGSPGRVELLADDEVVGDGPLERFTWSRFSLTGAGLTVGYATGIPPADLDYAAPFRFSGRMVRAWIDVDGEPVVDAVSEALDAIARQ